MAVEGTWGLEETAWRDPLREASVRGSLQNQGKPYPTRKVALMGRISTTHTGSAGWWAILDSNQ